jgi:hypothetical protein
MEEYALLINSEFKEIRLYAEKPVDLPHKQVTWHDVLREYGEPFKGLEGDVWVIRTVDPTTLPPPLPESITRRQCALQLVNASMATYPEALEMTQTGTPPATIQEQFDLLGEPSRTLAMIDFAATNYFRDNPLIAELMISNGMTPQQVDDFFRAASLL